jgi:hypothetical protein
VAAFFRCAPGSDTAASGSVRLPCPRSEPVPLYPITYRAWTPLPSHVHARPSCRCTDLPTERGHMHIPMHMHPCPRSTHPPLYSNTYRAWTPLPSHVHARLLRLFTQHDAERGHPLPPTLHVHARLLRLCTQHDAEHGHLYPRMSTLDCSASLPNMMPSVDSPTTHDSACICSARESLYPACHRAWTHRPLACPRSTSSPLYGT